MFRPPHHAMPASVASHRAPRSRHLPRIALAATGLTLVAAALVVVPRPLASGVANAAALTSPFAVKDGLIRAASKTPKPASGTEVVLFRNTSTATIKLTGSGRVVLALSGSSCGGMPVVAVSVDGKRTGEVLIRAMSTYFYPTVGTPVGAGTHTVAIQLVNDRATSTCDRNAILSAARMESPGTRTIAPPPTGGYGVPAGTHLTVHQGNLVITQPGTVIDALDVHGTIRIQAANVTIKRTLVRGGPAATKTDALIAAWWGFRNIQISDTTVRADNPSLHIDGLSGSNFTARRLDVSNVVDSVKVIGPNVVLADSWLHNPIHSDHDPNQPDGRTHDDSVQIEGGNNILLQGNKLEGAHNSAIMVTQNYSATSNVRIETNSLSGGACTINATQRGKGMKIVGMSILSNRFGLGIYGYACPMRLPRSSSFAISANVWLNNSTRPLPVQWF